MEKLSSILPSSPRIKSVDLDEAPPARPGAPKFGRKQGRNTIGDQVTMSAQARALSADSIKAAKDPKEFARGKMVEDISRNFFETRLNKSQPKSEEITEKIESSNELDPSREQALKAYTKETTAESAPTFSAEA